MDWDAFFKLHADLPREGPGTPQDVAWACDLAGVPVTGAALDAGSGPGGDVAALLQAVPDGTVLAVDSYDGFAAEAQARFKGDARVQAVVGDMMAQPGPFDLIWSAGAVYFVGVREALSAWRDTLAPGGAVALSAPCLFLDVPEQAVTDLFEGVVPGNEATLKEQIAAAGFDILGMRKVEDAGWEAYYQPMEARIAALRPEADAALTAVLYEAEVENATWRAHKNGFGYMLCVVRPS